MKTKRTVTVTEEQIYEVGDYVCEQTLINDKVSAQHWTTRDKNLHFFYYNDVSFLNTEGWWDVVPEPQFVPTDQIEGFDRWDHILLDHTQI